MKTHTTDFKNEIKKFGKQISSKVFRYFSFSLITEDNNFLITENGLNLVLEQFDKNNKEQIIEENINDIKIIQDSQLLRSLMKKIELETMVELDIKDVIRVNFGILVNENYEYLDYGNYVVYKKTYNASNKSWNYVCYDMMLYSMIQYKRLNISYPITIRNYLKAIADKMGIGFANENDDFTNYNQLIKKDYFQGKNVTLRDILDFLSQATASVICINENDELEIRYPQNVGEYETQEGTSLSIENAGDCSDLLFDLYGDTSQNGTPTSSTPVNVDTVTGRQDIIVEGKNLFNPTTFTTKNNVSCSQEGVITSTGSTTTAWGYSNRNITMTMKAGTYTFSLYISQVGSTSNFLCMRIYNSSNTQLGEIRRTNAGTYSTTITFSQETTIGIMFKFEANDVSTLQIENGSTSTDYKSYSETTYEINLGKNLFPIPFLTSTGSGNILLNYAINIPSGVYTLSFKNRYSPTQNQNVRFDYEDGTYLTITITPSQTQNTFTLAKNVTKLTWYVREAINISNIQLEKGSQATSYREYKTPIELCKIGDYKDFIRKGTGKNLFDKDNLNYVGRYYVSNNGTVTASAYDKMIYVKLEPNTTYTFTQTARSNVTVRPSLFTSIPEVNSVGTVLGTFTGTGAITQTFTTTNTAIYFTWVYYNQNSLNGYTEQQMLDSIQIELGNQSTLFEPYGFKDKWYLYKTIGKVVFNGSESWTKTSDVGISVFYNQNTILSTVRNALSNYFTYKFANQEGKMYFASDTRICFVMNSSYTDGNSFKTWLGTHNTTVYYVLATPTITEITDSELLNQLKSIELLEGINNITIDSNNLSSSLSLTYLSEMDTINEEYLKDINVNFGENFGPVNKISLVDSENKIEYMAQDDIAIEKNNLIEIRMTDNPILLNSDQEFVCNNILKKLSGIYYSINDFSLTGICYYDYLDIFKVSIEGNSYKCLLLNDEIEITQGLQETIYSDPLENSDTETDNYKTNNLSNKEVQQKIVQLSDNKVENKSVVSSINSSNETAVIETNKILNRKEITSTTDSNGFIDVGLNKDYVIVGATAQFSSNDYGFVIPCYYYNSGSPRWLLKIESKSRVALANTEITVIVYYTKIKEGYVWQI